MSDVVIKLKVPVLIKPTVEDLKTSETVTTKVLAPDGAGKTAWVNAPAGAGHTIASEGVPLVARAILNFLGAGVSVADNAIDGRTDVTIPGAAGGSGVAFKRMIIVNPNLPVLAGYSYQTYADALAYAETQSPTKADPIGILITGQNIEAIVIKSFIRVIGIKGATRLAGAVTVDVSVPVFNPSTGEGLYDAQIFNCELDNWNSNGRLCVTYNCQINGGNHSANGIPVIFQGQCHGGDMSICAQTVVQWSQILLSYGSSNNIEFGNGSFFSSSFSSQGGTGQINFRGGQFSNCILAKGYCFNASGYKFYNSFIDILFEDITNYYYEFYNSYKPGISINLTGGTIQIWNSAIPGGINKSSGVVEVGGNSSGLNISFGTTAQRPQTYYPGTRYFDTTIGKPIFWNGVNWVDATGSVV